MSRIVILATLLATGLHAATYTVTPDGSSGYSNIQDAVDAAPLGGWTEIVVHPGVYFENLEIAKNQHLVLRSTNECSAAVRAATIIDGGHTGTVLAVHGDSDNRTTCMVAGVTIRNGYAPHGGGIAGDDHYGKPLCIIDVRHCTLANCTAYSTASFIGGGAVAYTMGAVVSNTCSGNVALRSGGALFACEGPISYNLFVDNRADYNGGAVYAPESPVVGNVFSNNAAYSGGAIYNCLQPFAFNIVTRNYASEDGGGAYSLRSTLVHHNIFSHNVAGDCGGAICSGSDLDFVNNLVYGNTASNQGGAIFGHADSLLLNSTIAHNYALHAGGGIHSVDNALFINAIVAGNLAGSNAPADLANDNYCGYHYSCLPGRAGVEATCVTTTPGFANAPAGNFRLSAGSPCVNTGGSNFHYPLLYAADLDGRLRVEDVIDMGCYERASVPDRDGDWWPDASEASYGADSNTWDTNGDGYPDGLHLLRGQGVDEALTTRVFHVAAGASVQAAYGLAVPGDAIMLGTGVFREFILPLRGIALHGATNSAGALLTVLDGEGRRPCLEMHRSDLFDGTGLSTVVAGLVLSNGYAHTGGGIRLVRADGDTVIENVCCVANRAVNGGGIGGPANATLHSVRYCHLLHNTAENEGGAVYHVSDLNHGDGIYSCLVAHNTASNGGGVADCLADIERCTIVSNTAAGQGGGLFEARDDVFNCLIAFNRAAYGGGIGAPQSSCRMLNNTLLRNAATVEGGGVHHQGSPRRMYNNIIWSNSAPASPQLLYIAPSNYIFHNTIQDWADSSQGNRSAEPLFVDFAASDFHVRSNDAANVNTGTNIPPEVTAMHDLDGNSRVIDASVDRGCYEVGSEGFDIATLTQRFAIILEQQLQTPYAARAAEGAPEASELIRYLRFVVVDCGASGPVIRTGRAWHPGPPSYMDWAYPIKRLFTDGLGWTFVMNDADAGPLGRVRERVPSTIINGFDVPWEQHVYKPRDLPWSPISFSYVIIGDVFDHVTSLPDFSCMTTEHRQSDIAPRDGYPGEAARISKSFTNKQPAQVQYLPPTLTSILPEMEKAAMVGTPGDTLLTYDDSGMFGRDRNYLLQGDPYDPRYAQPVTMILPPLDVPYDSFTPAYVDLNGDGTLDNDKLWVAYNENANNELTLYDALNGTDIMTVSVPATPENCWHVGSYPHGVAAAPHGDKVLYVYNYTDPVHPEDGTWLSTVFECAIIRIGYATSPEIIPEPVLATLVYLIGAGLLGAWIVRR